MGKLRIVPPKPLLSDQRYREIYMALKEARKAPPGSKIFWDLDKNESPSQGKKDFHYVAEKECIPLRVRRPKNMQSLELIPGVKDLPGARMPAAEARKRILKALEAGPLSRSDVIQQASISPSSWNLRISELKEEGKVVMQGEKRNAVYALPKKSQR